MASQRHLELLPIIHYSIYHRFELEDKNKDLDRKKLMALAEENKYILEANPEAEHIYMEKVIVEYGKVLDPSEYKAS